MVTGVSGMDGHYAQSRVERVNELAIEHVTHQLPLSAVVPVLEYSLILHNVL